MMLEIENQIKKININLKKSLLQININLKKSFINLDTLLNDDLFFILKDLLLEDIFSLFYIDLQQALNEILWKK